MTATLCVYARRPYIVERLRTRRPLRSPGPFYSWVYGVLALFVLAALYFAQR